MASINITNLNATGSELFIDSESFINDLSDAETMHQGGLNISDFTTILITTIISGPII